METDIFAGTLPFANSATEEETTLKLPVFTILRGSRPEGRSYNNYPYFKSLLK